MNIALTKHFEEVIARLVDSGRYNNSSEVVRAGLRIRGLLRCIRIPVKWGANFRTAITKIRLAPPVRHCKVAERKVSYETYGKLELRVGSLWLSPASL